MSAKKAVKKSTTSNAAKAPKHSFRNAIVELLSDGKPRLGEDIIKAIGAKPTNPTMFIYDQVYYLAKAGTDIHKDKATGLVSIGKVKAAAKASKAPAQPAAAPKAAKKAKKSAKASSTATPAEDSVSIEA